ncbi:MAG: transcription termination/antitermination NusG family protein [Bacillota bacterium]
MQYTVGSADPQQWVSPDSIGAIIRYQGKACRLLGMYFGGDPDLQDGSQRLHQWLILEDVGGEYPSWYAVQTKPRKESAVEATLDGEGVMVLLPRFVYQDAPGAAGGQKRRRGRPRKDPAASRDRVEPMFPGYLFVQLAPSDHDRWQMVRRNPWVLRVLGTGEEPVPVPDEAIDIILEKSFGSGIVVFRDGRPAWRDLEAGARVEITEEPFRGLVGILEKPTSGRRRVRVLLQIMGQEVPVEVDAGSLKPVDERADEEW